MISRTVTHSLVNNHDYPRHTLSRDQEPLHAIDHEHAEAADCEPEILHGSDQGLKNQLFFIFPLHFR